MRQARAVTGVHHLECWVFAKAVFEIRHQRFGFASAWRHVDDANVAGLECFQPCNDQRDVFGVMVFRIAGLPIRFKARVSGLNLVAPCCP